MVELTVTDLEFGKGTKRKGRYSPFCQISDGKGLVVGRSMVLFDCCVSARWPPIKMNWGNMIQRQANRIAAAAEAEQEAPAKKKWRLSLRKKKKQRELSESDLASAEEVVVKQPLLITVYNYRKNGEHAILGQVNTTIQEMKAKAQQFEVQSDRAMRGKFSGRHKEASFRFTGDSLANLCVKRCHSMQGKPDPLLQANFFDPKLKAVPAPRGLKAKKKIANPQVNNNWDIQNGESMSSFEETLPTECSSRIDDCTDSSWPASPLVERSDSVKKLLVRKRSHSIKDIEVPSIEEQDDDDQSDTDDTSESDWMMSPRVGRPGSVKKPLQPQSVRSLNLTADEKQDDSPKSTGSLQRPGAKRPDVVKHPQHEHTALQDAVPPTPNGSLQRPGLKPPGVVVQLQQEHQASKDALPPAPAEVKGSGSVTQHPRAERSGSVTQQQVNANSISSSNLEKKASTRSLRERVPVQPLMDGMKTKLRRLAELRAKSERGALPPTEAQEFQVLTRLLERFETQNKQKRQAAQRRAEQVKAQKVSLSPAAETKAKIKRMEEVLALLFKKCLEQGKFAQFKAYLKVMERLEKEKTQKSPVQFDREKDKVQQGSVLSRSLGEEIKTKLGQLEELKTRSARDFSNSTRENDNDNTAVPALQLEEQVEQLQRLSQRLENHELGLRADLRRQYADHKRQQGKVRESIGDILTESMKVKLRSMEATIQTICDVDSREEEAKYIAMFIKLLDSWEEEEETEEEEEIKQEQAKVMQGEGLNMSLIQGLSAKLKQVEHVPVSTEGESDSDSDSFSDSDDEEESDDDEDEQGDDKAQATKKQGEDEQAALLARLLQRLEGHEARRKADVQRLERERIERAHPSMAQSASTTPDTVACF